MAVYNRFLSTFNAYPKMIWLLAIACFLNIGGLSFLWPLNSIYIHEELGKPLTVAGIVLLLHSAGAALGHLLGGILFDRMGARPVLLIGLFISAVVLSLIGVYDSWPLYIAVMITFGFSASLTFPAINSLGAKSWPEGGRRAFNFLYVANNLGVAAGTALGGLVAQVSFQAAFMSAAVTMILLFLFVFLFIRDSAVGQASAQALNQSAASDEIAATVAEEKVPWVPIIALLVGFILMWITYVQWQTSIAVHIQDNGIELAAYSVIWTINGLVIFLGQPLLAYVVRFFQSMASQMLLGTALFILTFALLLTSDSYSIFIVGMIIMTFGEMLLWPGVPAAVAQISPPSRLGFLQGFIGSGATVGRMLGPLLGGLLYDHTSYANLLLCMLALLIVPMVSFGIYAKTVRNQRKFMA